MTWPSWRVRAFKYGSEDCSLLANLVAKRTFSLEDSASLTGRFVELHWNTLVQLTDFLNSEHPFRTIKRQLSYAKVRDRSLSKNTNLFYLFAALSNMRSDRFAVFKPFYASFTAVVLVLFRHVGAAAASNASLVFVTRAWPCSSWSIHWSSP
ncbi:MAG: hypothetical protein ABJM11_11005 [Marinobacter sp.]|uniref:hypothetical protein n=1 Tax=Marinobacter sp. TaxID=50741 RepID=UPI003296A4DE